MIDIYELLRRNQDRTSNYVRATLEEMGVAYDMDKYGNIYYLDNENVPLLSAHMDTVRKEEDLCIGAFLNESEDDKIFSGGILGGDDKCGVYIILKVLETGRKVNFIFSRDEEIGCLGIKALLKPNYSENKELTDKVRNCLYCLVLDRKHNNDIVCEQNDYGTEEFEKALEKISNEGNFGYRGARGLCSDANTIRDYISTANLSVGYFEPHSQKEYISKKDLQNALDYTIAIIDNLKEQFKAAEVKTYNYYSNRYYNSYYDFPGYFDDDFDGYDYSDWSWQDWKNYDLKGKKGTKCSFCEINSTKEPLYEMILPNGEAKMICEFCLEDLENEIKRIRLLINKV